MNMLLINIAQAATEGAAPAAGINALGLDWKALLFQVLNFAILLWLLKRFAYQPILKVLNDRRQKIEESLKTAQQIAITKTALDKEQSRMMQEAQTNVKQLIAQGEKQAGTIIEEAQAKAMSQAERIVTEGKARLRQEEAAIKNRLHEEAVTLVKEVTGRLIKNKLDSKNDETLIKETIKEVQTNTL